MATGLGTDLQIRTRLGNILSDNGTLDARWNTRISQVNGEAEHDIFGRLIARAYTVAQINTWDLLQETHIDLATMLALEDQLQRLERPQLEIYDRTMAKIEKRLMETLPLTNAQLTIDSAAHDDNFVPVRQSENPDDDDRFFNDTAKIVW